MRFFTGLIGWLAVSFVGLGAFVIMQDGPTELSVKQVEDVRADEPLTVVSAAEADMRAQMLQGFDPKRVQDQTRVTPVKASASMAYVTASAVNMRSGPSTNFEKVGRAVNGQGLELTGSRDGMWVEVRLDEGLRNAWIHGKFLQMP